MRFTRRTYFIAISRSENRKQLAFDQHLKDYSYEDDWIKEVRLGHLLRARAKREGKTSKFYSSLSIHEHE